MLVLSRKVNESIVIDGDIRITVVSIRGNQVRLGIEAPSAVGIFREELVVPAESGEANAMCEPSRESALCNRRTGNPVRLTHHNGRGLSEAVAADHSERRA